ncbi:hypothetical protein [Nonomuraea dietziae]|uniref:hypothetical protein n=1 Tax=Nonomuraea dietziae TaxID=65515 RepID=UPI0033C66C4E
MARDENDRPEMTGDVLSDRWTPDSADTDEQPAVDAEGEPRTPDQAPAPAQAAAPPAPTTQQIPPEAADVLVAAGPADPVAPEDVPLVTVLDAPPVVTLEVPDTEAQYLPLDQGYDVSGDSSPRGFLGSGWTEDSAAPEREVRRRTRLLLAGAAAVVVIGAAGGWMLTGSGGDSCAGGACASSRSLEPVATDAPIEQTETDAVVEPPLDPSQTPEASATVSESPEPVARVRPTRTPTPRPTVSRAVAPATRKPSATPVRSLKDDTARDGTSKTESPSESRSEAPSSSDSTEAPPAATEQPAPAPTQQQPAEEPRRGGLLDWLFG